MSERRVWVWIEVDVDGQPHKLSLELLTLARSVGTAEAVVLHPAAAATTASLEAHGAAVVHIGEDARYGEYVVDPQVSTLAAMLIADEPDLLLFPSMFAARDIQSRLVGRLGLSAVSNATDVRYDGNTMLITAPYGAETISTITLANSGPHLVQIRPKAFAVEQVGGSAEVREVLHRSMTRPAACKLSKRSRRWPRGRISRKQKLSSAGAGAWGRPITT